MISRSRGTCDKLSRQNADSADMTKRKLTYPVLLFVVVAAFYFVMPHAERGEGLRADKLCRILLAEKENREALSWLEQSKPGDIRAIGEQSPEDSLKIVKGLYAAGAVKTHVIGIERVTGYGETTNIVCVELPTAASARKTFFKIESKTASNEGFDPVPDEGQTYLFLYKFKLTFWQVLRSLVHT
jgi:hypothetical protein